MTATGQRGTDSGAQAPVRRGVVGSDVDACTAVEMSERIVAWARRGASRYVCYANAHMLVLAGDDPDFGRVVRGADLVIADGRPLVWMLRAQGVQWQRQIRGPDAMVDLLRQAAAEGLPVGFYGSTDAALEAMTTRARAEFPGIRIAYRHSPPFRPVTPAEDAAETAAIAASGARLLFVGLGCPKQERWMAAHRGRVPAVMLGVGAAFDQYSGRVPACPPAFSVLGLEWAYRSLREPRRLLWRNLRSTTLFAARAARQLLAGGRRGARP
jgi:N-acetylglucosaminyldiphosphoundecaprenol N-acetyl-beta-D-mannosaminyltransferase